MLLHHQTDSSSTLLQAAVTVFHCTTVSPEGYYLKGLFVRHWHIRSLWCEFDQNSAMETQWWGENEMLILKGSARFVRRGFSSEAEWIKAFLCDEEILSMLSVLFSTDWTFSSFFFKNLGYPLENDFCFDHSFAMLPVFQPALRSSLQMVSRSNRCNKLITGNSFFNTRPSLRLC